MKPIYVDNNATTRVAEEVFAVMQPYFCEEYGNPSSMHSVGGRVGPKLKEARNQVANLIGARSGKRHIVTSRVEHPAIGSLVSSLIKQGYRITEVPVDGDGCLDIGNLEESLTPDTALVTIMWANNETGVIFPVEEIARMCRQRGITFHTDAVQAFVSEEVTVQALGADLITLASHKFGNQIRPVHDRWPSGKRPPGRH